MDATHASDERMGPGFLGANHTDEGAAKEFVGKSAALRTGRIPKHGNRISNHSRTPGHLDASTIHAEKFVGMMVLVVGSGAGGLFVARELLRTGCKVTVAHEQPKLAAYASTRNQGWLQAGALYAGLEQRDVARECRLAASAIARLAPASVDHGRSCFYLFLRFDLAERFFQLAKESGIEVRSPTHVSKVARLGETIVDSPYEFVVEAFDRPFNAAAVLRIVHSELVRGQVEFVGLSNLLAPALKGPPWQLAGSTRRFDRVIIAAGAATPQVMAHLQQNIPHEARWITVLSVRGVKLDHMLVATEPQHPNIVPFARELGAGFTVVLGRDDQRGDPPADLRPFAQAIGRGVGLFFPALAERILSESGVLGHHACTKLVEPSGSTSRRYIIQEATPGDGLWFFYPGKFTTAILAARECSRQVLGAASTSHQISDQPYPP